MPSHGGPRLSGHELLRAQEKEDEVRIWITARTDMGCYLLEVHLRPKGLEQADQSSQVG